MNKRKWGGLIGIACVVVSSFIGLSNASYTSKDEKTNEFKSGQVDIEIQEIGKDGSTYENPKTWNGDLYIKNVSITNNSNVNTLIRVAIVPRWVDENNPTWAGDTSCVNIDFANLGTANGNWVKDTTTGYYYYNEIVKGSTNELIKSLKATIPAELQERYKGKKLIIDVKAETIMATKQAYEKAWSGIPSGTLKQMLDGLCV